MLKIRTDVGTNSSCVILTSALLRPQGTTCLHKHENNERQNTGDVSPLPFHLWNSKIISILSQDSKNCQLLKLTGKKFLWVKVSQSQQKWGRWQMYSAQWQVSPGQRGTGTIRGRCLWREEPIGSPTKPEQRGAFPPENTQKKDECEVHFLSLSYLGLRCFICKMRILISSIFLKLLWRLNGLIGIKELERCWVNRKWYIIVS